MRCGFILTEYKADNGKNEPCYQLDYESTMVVLTGYDVVARIKVIKRRQELEQQVSKPIDPMQVLNDPAAMRGLLLNYIEVGFCSSFFRQGDNTPIIKSVFLRLPFFTFPNFWERNSIMTELFGQPLWLVAPCRDSANSFNAVTRFLAGLRDGFTTLRQGITS